jgi:hypothetical protein
MRLGSAQACLRFESGSKLPHSKDEARPELAWIRFADR